MSLSWPTSSSALAEDLPDMHPPDSPAAVREALRELAGNLWFSWLPGVRAVFAGLDPERFDALGRSPVALVESVSDDELARAATPELRERLERARAVVAAERERTTWWDRR